MGTTLPLNKNHLINFYFQNLKFPSWKWCLSFNFLGIIGDILAMETIPKIFFIISYFQWAILSEKRRFGTPDTSSESWCSKQISQEAMKIKLTILLIYENIIAKFNHWNMSHHLPHQNVFPTSSHFPRTNTRSSRYKLWKIVAHESFINFVGKSRPLICFTFF